MRYKFRINSNNSLLDFFIGLMIYISSPGPIFFRQIRAGLNGNLCRCGTYAGIRKAVLDAARTIGKEA